MRALTETQALLLAIMQRGARVVGSAPPRPTWRIEPDFFSREWLDSSRRMVRNNTLAGLQRRGLLTRTVKDNQIIYELTEEGARGTTN